MTDPNPASFVKATIPLLTDPSLSDAEKIGLLGLGSWAWEKDHCWPTNAQLAERCGWMVKGKPSGDKARKILRRLEKAGCIRRVVVVTNGVPSRPRIELIAPSKPPGAESTGDGSKLPGDGAEKTSPRVDKDQPPGQNRPLPLVQKAPGTGQNGTAPGSFPPHYIDPVTDPGNQTQGIDPPHTPTKQARGGGVEKVQYDPVRDDPELRRMLAGLAEVGVRHVEQKRRVKALAYWLLARLEDNPTISGIAVKLWRIVSGKTSVDDAFGHWSGQMIPF